MTQWQIFNAKVGSNFANYKINTDNLGQMAKFRQIWSHCYLSMPAAFKKASSGQCYKTFLGGQLGK